MSTPGDGTESSFAPGGHPGVPRTADPFAPNIQALLIAGSPDPRTIASFSEVGQVNVVPSAAAARAVVTTGQFTGPEDVVVIDGAPSDAATLTTVQEFRRRGCSVMLLSARCDELATTA
ncbi:MAG: hypothetical protein EB027_06505, partial [Actinobacteria bacterium]|nr:hypothetical protein [Actinomycetota bacterium]